MKLQLLRLESQLFEIGHKLFVNSINSTLNLVDPLIQANLHLLESKSILPLIVHHSLQLAYVMAISLALVAQPEVHCRASLFYVTFCK